MASKIFKLRVTAPVTVECHFWTEDGGWIRTAEQLGITVHAGTFENAKTKMEDALAEHIESLLSSKLQTERRTA